MPAIRPGWCAASAHDTAARATIRQARRAGARAWRARHNAQGRARHTLRYGAGAPATRRLWAAIRQGASATTRPGLPTILPGMRAPGRTSAHLGVPAGPAGCSCMRLSFSNWFSTQ